MAKKNIDWANIGFGYIKTDYRYVSHYKNGAWDEGALITDETITLNECACVFQYAQTCFEGLKAYTTEDGHIVTFRPDLNAERMMNSAARLETLRKQLADDKNTFAAMKAQWEDEKKMKAELTRVNPRDEKVDAAAPGDLNNYIPTMRRGSFEVTFTVGTSVKMTEYVVLELTLENVDYSTLRIQLTSPRGTIGTRRSKQPRSLF